MRRFSLSVLVILLCTRFPFVKPGISSLKLLPLVLASSFFSGNLLASRAEPVYKGSGNALTIAAESQITYGFYVFSKTSDGSSGLSRVFLCLEAKDSSFQIASEKINMLFGIEVSKETARKASEKIGKDFFERDSKEKSFNEQNYKPNETVFVQIDGVKINTKESWKEYKLGLFYRKSDMKCRKSTPNRHSLQTKKLIGAITDNYLVELKQLIQSRMQQTGYYWSQCFVLISDGADWIANLFQKLFPGSEMILDWYHAMENLWKCAHDLFGKDSQLAKEWVAVYKLVVVRLRARTVMQYKTDLNNPG